MSSLFSSLNPEQLEAVTLPHQPALVLAADDEKFPPRQVQWFINNAKEEGLRASQVETYDDFAHKMAEFYSYYEQQCNKDGVVDFAELLLRSYELLTRNEIVREHYGAR